jgi:hypothetical protein
MFFWACLHIHKRWKDVLKEDFFLSCGLNVKIEYFTGKSKRVCPYPVWASDTISNYLFSLPFGEIATEYDQMFNISLDRLLQRYNFFT